MSATLDKRVIEIFRNGQAPFRGQENDVHNFVRDFYENVITTNKDFEQSACCISGDTRMAEIQKKLPEILLQHNYGCGTTIPGDDLRELTVADWGCGSGVDCYTLSYLVGENGKVIGIDMSEEQLGRARSFQDEIMASFHYQEPNVFLNKDYIELGKSIPDNSVDLVVSNCVINLSPDKKSVFQAIFDKLKEGGEVYISDIVLDRRFPMELYENPQGFARLLGECVGGALYIQDLNDTMIAAGFTDPRVVKINRIRDEVQGVSIGVYSAEIRAFKISQHEKSPVTAHLNPMDTACEDYGQIAVYNGTNPVSPSQFVLDDEHCFAAHKPTAVCRNTARMLRDTRLARYFEVTGPVRHFGAFDCSSDAPPESSKEESGGCCC
ncbi:methyltransferase domain-containing protein [candidate division KSB1 bacterium]